MMERIDRAFVRDALPARREDGHKGDFGKVLIVGGAVGYTGAPYLTALAAARSGCGLVFLGVPACIWQAEAVKCVSSMPFPLPDDGTGLAAEALEPLLRRAAGCDVVAIGPGLGRGAGAEHVVRGLLRATDKPVVLDADGLNAIAGDPDALDERRGRVTVLTPHDGELARLLGIPIGELARRERAETARAFAVAHGCTLVRKGHRTLVAHSDGRMLENSCGGSALSKGGSGDVLTGLIASLLAQGAAEAAACGVWLHARAGDLLAESLTPRCAAPEDLVRLGFPQAFREVETSAG